jgi:ubiquinone/menaquinone biosynthesis C-methylase UbiE
MIDALCKEKGFDKSKLRLSVGAGNVRYSNCINMDLYKDHKEVDVDIEGDITKKTPFDDETFIEVLMIHVIEHIERRYHKLAFDEIWRILKPNGRLIMGFPDAIECMKRFIDNKFGGRWNLYVYCLYGRQERKGDFHITPIERNDITDRIMNAGFKDIKWLQHSINVTLTAYKGEKLTEFI